jgi:hypothetical protein
MLAGFVPKLVIKESVAAEVAQKRKSRKHDCCHHEDKEQSAKRDPAVETAIEHPNGFRGCD